VLAHACHLFRTGGARARQQILRLPPLATSVETLKMSQQVKSKIRRSRAITSCHACRTQRTKCDRIHPVCGRCSKNSVACLWAGNTAKSSSAAQLPRQRQSSHIGFSAESDQIQGDILIDTQSEDSAMSMLGNDLNVESGQRYESKGSLPGHLTLQNGGRSRYVPNAFWANIGNEVGVTLDCLTVFL
jgi:Fungal Zn(2)-Cys(6) binuclear cluster domain